MILYADKTQQMYALVDKRVKTVFANRKIIHAAIAQVGNRAYLIPANNSLSVVALVAYLVQIRAQAEKRV